MTYKIVYKVAGSHVHMRVWVGERVGELALAGELRMRDEEFANFRKIFEACAGLLDTVIFEKQLTSSPATRENNGFHPA